jgi:hypothetical protein
VRSKLAIATGLPSWSKNAVIYGVPVLQPVGLGQRLRTARRGLAVDIHRLPKSQPSRMITRFLDPVMSRPGRPAEIKPAPTAGKVAPRETSVASGRRRHRCHRCFSRDMAPLTRYVARRLNQRDTIREVFHPRGYKREQALAWSRGHRWARAIEHDYDEQGHCNS